MSTDTSNAQRGGPSTVLRPPPGERFADDHPERADSEAKPVDLVEWLLAEQRSLTAVERFSRAHESGEYGESGGYWESNESRKPSESPEPAQAKYYRSLLPATGPGPGQQYAFSVDLDACSGCKACVVACHTLNGLEEDESWRRVGTVRGMTDLETPAAAGDDRLQHVTTACHHCADPGCLKGCPVKAYDKDPMTGIVHHLDDQCIGCKYCTMMCPYEIPRFSERLGIVRKCDMCHQRLAVGEAPACVQSCPNGAIAIDVVDVDADESEVDEDERLAPGAPLSRITRPTTRFRRSGAPRVGGSNRVDDGGIAMSLPSDPFGHAVPQDAGIDLPADSHWPLALMLVTTQVSVGMLIVESLIAGGIAAAGSTIAATVTGTVAAAAWLIAIIGMGVAPLHLGRPARAWRVFLGLRTSWLSREAVTLGQYVGLLSVAVVLTWLPSFARQLPASWVAAIPSWGARAGLTLAIATGVAGLFSSGMIYVATRRSVWRGTRTMTRFFGTALVGGLAATVVCLSAGDAPSVVVAMAAWGAALATAAKLAWEWRVYLGPASTEEDPLDARSRRLVASELSLWRRGRIASAVFAACVSVVAGVAALAMAGVPTTVAASVAFAAVVMGESLERLLYFSGVVYDRMPGTLR